METRKTRGYRAAATRYVVSIANTIKGPLPERRIRNITRVALAILRFPASSKISIAAVGPRRMRDLNWKFLGKKSVATILSFPFMGESVRGEIILCPSAIKRFAHTYGLSLQSALDYLLIHGIMHIAGYDHRTEREAKRMEHIERKIGAKLGTLSLNPKSKAQMTNQAQSPND